MSKKIVYLAHKKQNPFVKVSITTASSLNGDYVFVGYVMKNKLSLLGGQVVSCVDKLIVKNVLLRNYKEGTLRPIYNLGVRTWNIVDTIVIDSTQILHINVFEEPENY